MPEVWSGRDGSDQHGPHSVEHPEALGMEYLTAIDTDGSLLAWAGPGRWRRYEAEDMIFAAAPKLYLAQKAVYRLVHGQSLLDSFHGATIAAEEIPFLAAAPIAGSFPFWRTGSPVLVDAVFLLEGSAPKDLGRMLKKAVEALTFS